jgi:valyl-tRNA synthetase
VAGAEALRSGAPGGLAVVAGPIEAMVHPLAAGAEAAARDRIRLERELAGTETQLDGARARLADERFVAQAPAAVVERARARASELEERVARLRASLEG